MILILVDWIYEANLTNIYNYYLLYYPPSPFKKTHENPNRIFHEQGHLKQN